MIDSGSLPIYNNIMFYGRKYELDIIKSAIASNRAELGIVYGRRRIGKSALLGQSRTRRGDLYFECLEKVSQPKQIDHFLQQLADQTGTPKSAAGKWKEAFDALSFHIKKRKHYVVIDEFPWMASGRTELVSLLKYYWDNHWKKNKTLTLVLCGSIAAFMLNHVVHSKALHNRKTFEIRLGPLPASESKRFFQNYRSDFEIAKFLMVFGGVPKYLEQIDPRKSFSDNVDRLCFRKHGFFLTEFNTIFKEQFKVARNYERIVRELAAKGRSKEELAQNLGMPSGGGLTGYFESLEQADFIKTQTPKSIFGKGRKTRKLALWDDWLRFYFTYMEPNLGIIEMNTTPGLFEKLAAGSLNSYLGTCFEKLCMKNLPSIMGKMGLDLHQVMGFGPFFRQRNRKGGRDEGLQIDILVRRRGRVLTLIECKFSSRPVGTEIVAEVERKIRFLKAPRNDTIERVLICGGDVTAQLQNEGYFHHILGLDALFP